MHIHPMPRFQAIAKLGTVAAAALLAGCSFIPQYQRPAAPVPEHYTAPAQGSSTTETKAAADIEWQDYFTDPRLQRLIHIALENNRDLRVAMLNVEQARAQFQIQRASLYPTVNAIGNATRQPNTTTKTYGNVFQAGLGISAWEPDFFGRLGALKEQALAQYLATDEARKAAQISLVASVASGWLTLMADEELLDISRRTLSSREQSAKLIGLRMEHGVSSDLDNQQAQTLVQAARATYAQQQRQRMQDENALALLLGQPLPSDIGATLAKSRLVDAAPMRPLAAGLPSDLLQRRPDIRRAEQLLIAANANIGAARAAFFPRISLTASFGSVSTELSGLFKSGSWAFSLAPQLALPIFDAGRNQANLEAARAGQQIAVAQYEKAIQVAFREVSDSLAGLGTLQEQQDAQAALVKAAGKSLELSQLRYETGVASHMDLLDAQRSMYSAEQSLVATRLQQLLNQVALYKTLGGGWSDDTQQASTQSPGKVQ